MDSVAFRSVNTIRLLAADMVQQANSGHPGFPMGAAPMAYAVWQNFLRFDPSEPLWPNRDRFVLSPGHGSALLYAMLHVMNLDLPLSQMRQFRQWDSKTPGHPEFGWTVGVEATTGPLGQGAANAVGMAIAERILSHRFNRPGFEIVNHRTYAIVSDGDLMEGVCCEAASLAGHLGLDKLTFLYDANDITLDGPTSLAFSREDVGMRFEAYGWHVLHVDDGNSDLDGIHKALEAAVAETDRPSMIVIRTTIGFGAPNKQGSHKVHGSPLGPDELALVKKSFGFDPSQSFVVPDDVRTHCAEAGARGKALRSEWSELFQAYSSAHPELAEQWREALDGVLPEAWDSEVPVFTPADAQATRNASKTILNAIARRVPWLMSGDADLSSSTLSSIDGGGSFNAKTGAGRNIHYGVREHAMAAIANGIVYHGGVRPIISTFLSFADYMRPSIRVAALSHLPVIYLFSHDSVAVGEDGPTHQPVEQLASLRLIPNVMVLRPADPNETAEAWRFAMQYAQGPVVIATTRQKVPVCDSSTCSRPQGLHRGGYVLRESTKGTAQVVLLATGSEVGLALQASQVLEAEGIATRVVSMPCLELFAQQPESYQREVLPDAIPRVGIEAGVRFGWDRWVGSGEFVTLDRFGASAPGELVMDRLGFNPNNVCEAARRALRRHSV